MTDTTTTTDTPPETPPDGGPTAPNRGTKADLANQIQALTTQVQTLMSANAKAEAAAVAAVAKAEEDRKASLTEAQRLAEERNAFAAEVEGTKATFRKEARNQALDRLGVLPAYTDYVPDVDPRTPEGAKALSDWAREHPEAVRATAPTPSAYAPPPKSALARILSGETSHPLLSADGIRRMLGH